jgi:hypothetical protein
LADKRSALHVASRYRRTRIGRFVVGFVADRPIRGTIEREKATMGILVSIEDATTPM